MWNNKSIVNPEEFEIKDKNDLLNTMIRIKVDSDYHGCAEYEFHTPFGLCETLDKFREYISMLTIDEIINYRDNYDGSILHDIVTCNKDLSYFKYIYSVVKYRNFVKLVKHKDRSGNDAITKIKDLNLFKEIVKITGIERDEIRRMTDKCSNEIIDYITELIIDETKSSLLRD